MKGFVRLLLPTAWLVLMMPSAGWAGDRAKGSRVPDSGAASLPAAVRARVVTRLEAGGIPVTAAELRQLSPVADQALLAIAEDEQAEIVLRARAVAAMGELRSPAGRAFLERLVRTRATSTAAGDKLLLRRAAVALGWMGGAGVPGQLKDLFDNGDPAVRLDAVIGMGLTRLPEAAARLRSQLRVDPDPQVRSQISRQLRTLDLAAAAAVAH